ncbi:hypothetical protein [Chromobacterium sphagni]|uniref:hypothetical protein n=1 Tax=Chromobacterium sphagni TaxID=1903179 RepID=UPI0011142B7A|nr:hypothetical protein [Chromobacterium sphagni]
MLMQNVIPVLFIIPFAVYGIYFEMGRRDRVAREMAREWLQKNYPGCVVKVVTSNKMVWPVRIVLQVYTPKNEDFEIKLRVGEFFGGVFGDRVEVVYIRKIKPKT